MPKGREFSVRRRQFRPELSRGPGVGSRLTVDREKKGVEQLVYDLANLTEHATNASEGENVALVQRSGVVDALVGNFKIGEIPQIPSAKIRSWLERGIRLRSTILEVQKVGDVVERIKIRSSLRD